MDIKELNKPQLIMLLILLSFVVSIATSIITTSLMQEAPTAVSVPINKIVRQTVEKIVPATVVKDENDQQALSDEQKKLLEELKAIKPLTVSLYLKGNTEDKILGTGLFLGDNKVVIAAQIESPKEGEEYIVKSALGTQKVSKVTQEKDFTIVEIEKENSSQVNENNPTTSQTDTNTGIPTV